MSTSPSATPTSDVPPAKLSWKSFGPGILMASAAIGSSHLVASTQAGAIYGWQLAIMIVLANLVKYPFFRAATDYAYITGESLISGYARQSKIYLWAYFLLCIASGVISVGAVSLLTAVILGYMLPFEVGSLTLSIVVLFGSWVLLIAGNFKVLDNITKVIVVGLTITTVLAVFIAMGNPIPQSPEFVTVSPWTLVGLTFIVQLMGWMPTPLEFAAITSIWTAQKIKDDHTTHRQGLIDFNVGYLVSAILALFFLALGVFMQYGSGKEIPLAGGAYVSLLIEMYTMTIGEWAKLLVAFVAFLCMFGTVITCADGYGRGIAECLSLVRKTPISRASVIFWTTFSVVGGLLMITVFKGQMGAMLKFAMISAFVTAPIFAWLNYALIKKVKTLNPAYHAFMIFSLLFLVGFTLLFIANHFKLFG